MLLEMRISHKPSRNSVFHSATQVKPCRAGLGTGWVTRREYPVLKAPTLLFFYFFFIFILEDPGAVSRLKKKGATKV